MQFLAKRQLKLITGAENTPKTDRQYGLPGLDSDTCAFQMAIKVLASNTLPQVFPTWKFA
uniref:Uncharacterized protein n=1 Tax=Anguilla anguilla TaxID=7936 RepID=A0A0E9TTH0_ANGAN